jgi:hypothetical protein
MTTAATETPGKKSSARRRATRPTIDIPAVTPDQIARLASELHVEAGCPGGRDFEFWIEAERRLRGEHRD